MNLIYYIFSIKLLIELFTNFEVSYSDLEIYFHKNNKICKIIFRIKEDS